MPNSKRSLKLSPTPKPHARLPVAPRWSLIGPFSGLNRSPSIHKVAGSIPGSSSGSASSSPLLPVLRMGFTLFLTPAHIFHEVIPTTLMILYQNWAVMEELWFRAECSECLSESDQSGFSVLCNSDEDHRI